MLQYMQVHEKGNQEKQKDIIEKTQVWLDIVDEIGESLNRVDTFELSSIRNTIKAKLS